MGHIREAATQAHQLAANMPSGLADATSEGQHTASQDATRASKTWRRCSLGTAQRSPHKQGGAWVSEMA